MIEKEQMLTWKQEAEAIYQNAEKDDFNREQARRILELIKQHNTIYQALRFMHDTSFVTKPVEKD